MVDDSTKLLSAYMRAKALDLSKNRIKLASIEIKDDYFDAIKSLREQVRLHKPGSGIYIWRATAKTIGNVMDKWIERMDLYETTTADNREKMEFLTENGKAPVEFNLTPISYQWMAAAKELRSLETSFTLYVGQRSGSKLKSRLLEHCSASAQNQAIKLAGTSAEEVRIQEGRAKRCFETFRTKDHALLRDMGFKALSCDIIPVDEKEASQIKYHESIIKSLLLPMLGRS